MITKKEELELVFATFQAKKLVMPCLSSCEIFALNFTDNSSSCKRNDKALNLLSRVLTHSMTSSSAGGGWSEDFFWRRIVILCGESIRGRPPCQTVSCVPAANLRLANGKCRIAPRSCQG